jgi:hypothetical protein
MTMEFIRNRVEYVKTLADIAALIDFSRELPEYVFRQPAKRHVFTEMDVLADARTWDALKSLASYYGDTEILLIGDPPHHDNWKREGHTGAARMPVDQSSSEYRTLVWESTPNRFEPSVTLLVLASPSGGYAVWGDRSSEVAIWAFYDRLGRPASAAPLQLPQFTTQEAIQMLAHQFWPKPVPDEYQKSILRLYGTP